jgi:hypothetical protein
MQQSAEQLLDRQYHPDTAATVNRGESVANTGKTTTSLTDGYALTVPWSSGGSLPTTCSPTSAAPKADRRASVPLPLSSGSSA